MKTTEDVTGEVMPKEAAPTEESKKILAVTRGWITNAKLADLRDAYKDITATTAKGYKECVRAIATVRGLRAKLEKSRLEKNRGDHEKISIRNKEAKRILAALVEIETPLKEMRRVEDERAAKERAEAARIEKERVDAIRQRMEDNFGQHCIDDLAGMPSAYMQARIRIIEAYAVDAEYQEFKDEAALLQQQLLSRINRIFLARREQEQADKQLKAEKAKLDAQKQEMADQAKRFEEQQKAFEEERAEWKKKRADEEEARKEEEAETSQAVEEDTAQEPATEDTGRDEAETEEEGQVTEQWPENHYFGQGEDVDTTHEEEPGDQAKRDMLVELIQAETGNDEFDDADLNDLLTLAEGMHYRFDGQIRYLAGLVRKDEAGES